MGGRIRSNAKVAAGPRGHISKAGVWLAGSRGRSHGAAPRVAGRLAFAAQADAALGDPEQSMAPTTGAGDRDAQAADVVTIVLGALFLLVLIAVTTVRL